MEAFKKVGYTIAGGVLGFSFTVGAGEAFQYMPGFPNEQEANKNLAYYKEQLPILEEDYKKAVIKIGESCFKLINPIFESSDSLIDIATNLISDKSNSCGNDPIEIKNNLTNFFNAKNAVEENITNTNLVNDDLDRVNSTDEFNHSLGFAMGIITAIGGFIYSNRNNKNKIK